MQVGDFINLAHTTGSGNGIPDCATSSPTKLDFTFWDSTEVTTKFVNSQTAKATVYMAVAMNDEDDPIVEMDPLYWNTLKDNSIYDSSSASSYASLKGHIELPDDLPAAFTADATDAVMDRDPKLSGKIVLTGTVSDNKMLSKILMSITNGTESMNTSLNAVKQAAADAAHCKTGNTAVTAYPLAVYSSGSWQVASDLANNGIEFSVSDNVIDSDGHRAKWKLVWDTGKVSNFAATDLKVKVFACDQIASAGTGSACTGIGGTEYAWPTYSDNKFTSCDETPTTATAKTSYYKVDVVPYITGLETAMTQKGAVYGRTSTGRYPVYFYKNSKTTAGTMETGDFETITVKGFNLAENHGNLPKTVGESGDITASVELAVTVNGVTSLNNLNNNDAHGAYATTVAKADWNDNIDDTYNSWKNYTNRQPNNEINLLLTDDVKIDVWQINNKAAVPLKGIANDVHMKINQTSGRLGFAFVSGPLNTALATKDVSYKTWATSKDFCKSIGLEIDSYGNCFGTGAGGDTGSYYADAFGLYCSLWGSGNTQTSTGTWQQAIESVGQAGAKKYDANNKKNVADTADVKYNNNTPTGEGCKTNQWRIVSPSLASTNGGTSSDTSTGTNIYLAYYDKMNGELRFRQGNNAPKTGSANGWEDFIDNFTKNDAPYTYANCQIVAQDDDSNGKGGTAAKPGPYVSIAAHHFDSGDVVVLVWNDPINNCMWYCWNDDPTTSRKGTINNQSGSGQGWSAPKTVFNDVSGEYCKVAFDHNGKVHIAAYDFTSGDLNYAYLDNYKKPENAKTCVVDSNGNVGSEITLDVALVGSKPVPYIGYYADGYSLPKLASYAGSDIATDTYIKGAEEDLFTDKWDVSMVPTATELPVTPQTYDLINIGVWKTDGVLTISTNADAKNYAGTGAGVCYGNGTNNPALAYRCQNGYVEMAQKK
ncbi:MAG: hypothetical protein K5917_02055 [Clostridiales bacterium]|nr:hypothetical protein [Clostridiales bacterium]